MVMMIVAVIVGVIIIIAVVMVVIVMALVVSLTITPIPLSSKVSGIEPRRVKKVITRHGSRSGVVVVGCGNGGVGVGGLAHHPTAPWGRALIWIRPLCRSRGGGSKFEIKCILFGTTQVKWGIEVVGGVGGGIVTLPVPLATSLTTWPI